MTEAVLIRELVLGRGGDGRGDDGREFRIVLIREEHRLDVGVLDAHMHHPVVLLVLAGEFVLLDGAGGVVVGVGAEHEPVLGTAVHRLRVDIIARLGVPQEPSPLLPLAEVLDRLVIDAPVVIREDRVKVYLRLRDVQQGFLPGHLDGLLRVQYIIRRRSHLSDNVFWRT